MLSLLALIYQKLTLHYNITMLVIKAIKFRFSKQIVPFKMSSVRIGYKDTFQSTSKKPILIDSHSMQWIQDISLPLLYNLPLQITITSEQNSGNPQKFNQLSASMKIVDYNATSQKVEMLYGQKIRFGTAIINYKVFNSTMIVPQDIGHFQISSMLAHLYHNSGSTGHLILKLGNRVLSTPQIEIIAGQLLFSQELLLPLQETSVNAVEITFQIIIDEKLTGVSKMQFKGKEEKKKVKYRRLKIMRVDEQQIVIGTLFIDILYKPNKDHNDQKSSEAPSSKSRIDVRYAQLPSIEEHNLMRPTIASSKKVIQSKSQRSLARVNQNAKSPIILKKNYQLDKFGIVFNLGEYSQPEQIKQTLKRRRIANSKTQLKSQLRTDSKKQIKLPYLPIK